MTDTIIQSIATAPGLAAAVVIVWIFSKGQERVEELRQDREDQREKARMVHEAELAERYAELGTRHVHAMGEMVTRIEQSHRDIFSERRVKESPR